MHVAQGTVIGYNCQSAVDAKHKLIVADDVTNEVTDLRQLSGVAREARETLSVEKLEVVADPGYYNNADVSVCVEQNITPYIRKMDTSANSARGLYAAPCATTVRVAARNVRSSNSARATRATGRSHAKKTRT